MEGALGFPGVEPVVTPLAGVEPTPLPVPPEPLSGGGFVPPSPPAARDDVSPLEPECAVALDGPLGVTPMAWVSPVLPEEAEDCEPPPVPPAPAAPPSTSLAARPVEPELASADELEPVAATSTAVDFPLLPDWLLLDAPPDDWPGGTPLSMDLALPVLPDSAFAELPPMGATDNAVASPELPDCAPDVGAGLLPVSNAVGSEVLGAPPPLCWPWFAAPLLPDAALPASPDLAPACASPMPATARAVALPEPPDCAVELCASLFWPVVSDGDEPELLLFPPPEPAPPLLTREPPALPDWADEPAEPVGAAATAMAEPEPPDCACELSSGWMGAVAVCTPSVGCPSQVEPLASPDRESAVAGPMPPKATAMAGPLPPAVEH